ncbi:MAG TPA: hypothetical protein VFV34_16700 [Blastocatellia bacterium]|nr:hypothetical protein [Blastocatellia bacterium]
MDLPVYRVKARNTSADSENRIHDDSVASRFGFRGGLVPGVTIYGYMTVPIVERFPEWLERGRMTVRFVQPLYDGDEVTVRATFEDASNGTVLTVDVLQDDRAVSAIATAHLNSENGIPPRACDYPEADLPDRPGRPTATPETLKPGTVLGTLVERVDLEGNQEFLEQIEERLPCYRGPNAVAHPAYLLGLSNQVFLNNFALGPWIHAASEVTNWSTVRTSEVITVRARVVSCYERKGHDFAVLDVLIASGDRIVQQVRHTTIYRPRVG